MKHLEPSGPLIGFFILPKVKTKSYIIIIIVIIII